MSVITSPIRSPSRSPLRGPLEGGYGESNPLSIIAQGGYVFFAASNLDFGSTFQIADADDTAGDNHTVDVAITGSDGTATPTFTLTTTTGLTINSGTNGSAAINFTGTIAEVNAALLNSDIAGFTDSAWRTMSVQYTNEATSGVTSKVIILQSLIALDTGSIADSTAIGTVIEDFGADTGALHPEFVVAITAGDQTYRPIISNVAVSGEGETTADVDLDVHMLETTAGTLWWYVGTSATIPSVTDLKAGTGAVDFGNQAISNSGTTAPEAQAQINVTGLSASTTYYVHTYCEDANGANPDIASQQPSPTSFSTTGASVAGSPIGLLLGLTKAA